MYKRILLSIGVAALILGFSKLSFAMNCADPSGSKQMAQADYEHEHGTTEVVKEAGFLEKVVNVGNKICPVSGEKIDEKLKATYEYDGKLYNFCCVSCVDDFKKDPQKYIKKVEQELQAESKGQATHEGHEMGSMQETGTAHQGMHH